MQLHIVDQPTRPAREGRGVRSGGIEVKRARRCRAALV